jgi:FkbM family methyltransferase
MSLSSFLTRCAHDPSYFVKRLRWETWRLSKEREVEIQSLHGRLRFSSKDQIIGRALYLTGEFAMSEIEHGYQLLVRDGVLKPTGNGILLDIGSNIGTTCVPLLKRGYFEKSLAFEPEPKNVALLRRNIESNALSDRIEVCPFALSSEEGKAELFISPKNFGDHRVRADATDGTVADRKRIGIELKTLDRTLEEKNIPIERISLAWIDTQGHEGKVLKGARSLLNSSVPMVLEFWPEGLIASGESLDELCNLLASAYKSFYVLQDSTPVKRATTEISLLGRQLLQSRDYRDLVLLPKVSS